MEQAEPDSEEEEESEDDLDEDEEYGADPLQKQLENQVLCRLSQSCKSLGTAVGVGGSLGRLQVSLSACLNPAAAAYICYAQFWKLHMPLSWDH